MGITRNHHKDPFLTTKISWKVSEVFFFVAHERLRSGAIVYPSANQPMRNLFMGRFLGDSNQSVGCSGPY